MLNLYRKSGLTFHQWLELVGAIDGVSLYLTKARLWEKDPNGTGACEHSDVESSPLPDFTSNPRFCYLNFEVGIDCGGYTERLFCSLLTMSDSVFDRDSAKWNPLKDTLIHRTGLSGIYLDFNPGLYRQGHNFDTNVKYLEFARRCYRFAKTLFLRLDCDEADGFSETYDPTLDYDVPNHGSKVFHFEKGADQQLAILPFEENREATCEESKKWSWRGWRDSALVFPPSATVSQIG